MENNQKTHIGRPRIIYPQDDELEALGQEMVDWVKNTPDALHLSEWYTCVKRIIYKDWKAIIQRDLFLPYYEEALRLMGKKYLQKNSEVEPNIKNRWQRVYFGDLRESEDADLDAEAARKKVESTQPNEIKVTVNGISARSGTGLSS